MELLSEVGGWVIALLYLAGLAGGVGTLLGFFGRTHWLLDLFSHFRVQYAALLAACALGFGLMLRPYEAAAAGVLAILNLFLIVPFYLKPPTAGRKAAHDSSLIATRLRRRHLP